MHDVSKISILMNLIENAEQAKEDKGYSPKMMVDDKWLVSNDCYTEGWDKRLKFIGQSQLVPTIREQVIKMN